jgi:tripartite-type tricarboxylate transporter receptor subunit TctC
MLLTRIAARGRCWIRCARRSVHVVASCASLVTTLALPAAAQPATSRVTLIVPASAGGSTDVIARVLGEHMARTLDRIVTIENVSGGATTVASARTAVSAPDGTTVLVAQLPLLAAPFLFTGLAYDTQTAFAPVGLINAGYTVLMARKGLAPSPARAVEWLRANGASANIGNGGIGSSGHFCALLLARALGIRPAFVAYRGGGPAMNDLVGGTLDLVCDQSTNAVPQVQAGAVRGILVAGPGRIASIPDVPTSAELDLPDVSLAVWHGMYVARATPRTIVDRLNAALGAALADPAIAARFSQLGTSVFPPDQRSPEAHAAMFQAEYQRLGRLLSGMGITPQTVE